MLRNNDLHNHHRGLDGPPRPRRLMGVHLLPSAATLGNLLCGFLAIYCCALAIRTAYFPGLPEKLAGPHILGLFTPTWIAAGAMLIVLAMVFDALDGRLARIARRTTEFGAQLDSIADIVSFGAAPPLLLMSALLPLAVPLEGEPLISKLQWRAGVVAGLVYLSCAAIRLARYNTENIKGESAQKTFSGLPVPGAAAAFVALLVLHEDLINPGDDGWNSASAAAVLRWIIPPMAFLLGILMVSRLDYVHVFNVYVRRKQPPTHLVWLLLAIGVAFYSPQALLVLAAFAYVLSGPLLGRMRQVKKAELAAADRAVAARSEKP
jgi:CDP-diacylglycerol--serine O-phosphatidyltransferase